MRMARVSITMGLFGSGSGGQTRYFECRQCGTTVEAGTDVCPVCESEDIVEYEVA